MRSVTNSVLAQRFLLLLDARYTQLVSSLGCIAGGSGATTGTPSRLLKTLARQEAGLWAGGRGFAGVLNYEQWGGRHLDFSFSVGETEAHIVRFRYRTRLASSVIIDVDGDIVKEEKFRIYIPPMRRYAFRVGTAELSHVVIEVKFSRLGRAYTAPSCRVSVNGSFLGKY
jgi:hypothetical protein